MCAGICRHVATGKVQGRVVGTHDIVVHAAPPANQPPLHRLRVLHACPLCAAGRYMDGAGGVAYCHDCAEGQWTRGAVGQSSCVPLPTPSPTPSPTPVPPTPYPTPSPTPAPTPLPTPSPTPLCMPGTFTGPTFRRTGECDTCPAGKFQMGLHAPGCDNCTIGHFSLRGAVECTSCPPTHYAGDALVKDSAEAECIFYD